MNAQDADSATNTLNESLLSLVNKCFPVRTVTLSSRDPSWMTSLVKYLLKKKSRANASGNVSEPIAENRMNWGRAETTGTMQWWRRVDNISQRKNKPQPVLKESFLRGLNEFFAKLCQDDSYTESSFQEIDREKHLSPRLNETEVMLALSKIKKTVSGPDSIPYWVWRDNALLLAPVVIWNLSLCSYTWPEAWKESNISQLPKVDTPLQHQDFRGINVTPVIARCFEKIVYHKFSKHAFEENLGPTQYAYREGCNCTDSLINMRYNCLKALDDRECRYVRLCAMDFAKAFDNVRHNIVLVTN